MRNTLYKVLVLLACATALSWVPQAHATLVSGEILLLVDVSGSISASEYAIQKNGYVSAFQDSAIQALIAAQPGGIAVAYAEFSGATQQSLEVGWTWITDALSANAFATAISAATRNFSGLTAPGTAINWGVPLFTDNGYEGGKLIIDISGDGTQNSGANTLAAATAAWAAGIYVNGLPIGDASLVTWYQNNIVTPGHGFLTAADSFEDFTPALELKLSTEIVPEPASFALLGGGLLALGLLRRKRG